MIVVGVDIGLKGGFAVLGDGDPRVWSMPSVEREIGGKTRRRVDPAALADLIGLDVLGNYCEPGDGVAFVERAQASPQMGVSSSFAYGEAFGLVVGVLAHLRVPVRFVSPVVWKRALGIAKKGNREIGRDEERDKNPAIELARKLYPALHREINYAKDDGKAEALLIAHYGCEELGL